MDLLSPRILLYKRLTDCYRKTKTFTKNYAYVYQQIPEYQPSNYCIDS